MELSPSQVSNASFRTVKKGYDPDEVDRFLTTAAQALEDAQQQATAMEARARAAVSRLQEANANQQKPEDDGDVHASVDEAETISRTLLLAQRTADTTMAEAQTESDRMLQEARDSAETLANETREANERLIEEARETARHASDAEREAAENEVQSLKARREFLVGDVDQLEQFLADQRNRLREAAGEISSICDRIPGGLGEARPPVLSAADDEPGDDTAELFRPAGDSEADGAVDGAVDGVDADEPGDVARDDDDAAGRDDAGPDDDRDDDTGETDQVADDDGDGTDDSGQLTLDATQAADMPNAESPEHSQARRRFDRPTS